MRKDDAKDRVMFEMDSGSFNDRVALKIATEMWKQLVWSITSKWLSARHFFWSEDHNRVNLLDCQELQMLFNR